MRLTRYSDYAIRVLLHLGARRERLCSIAEMSSAYAISQNHLMKVVNDLANAGFVETVRGRGGGVRLGREPAEINIGALVRHTEGGFDLIDCTACVIAPACGVNDIMGKALAAFMGVLDGYSLEDLLGRRADIRRLFDLQRSPMPELRTTERVP